MEGEPLWLDVGLHCRGRGAPPENTRSKGEHLWGLLFKGSKVAAYQVFLKLLKRPRMFHLVCTNAVLTLDHTIWSITDLFHLPVYHGQLSISTFIRNLFFFIAMY